MSVSVPAAYANNKESAEARLAGYAAASAKSGAVRRKISAASNKAPKRRTMLGNAGLDSIARKAGLAPWMWPGLRENPYASRPINGILMAREAALSAAGWRPGKPDTEGYTPWTRGAETLRIGPFGAIYLGAGGWQQMPRDERDALTESGRVAVSRHRVP